MKEEELELILENHKKWLNHESDGIRANLSGANLRDANLSGANLRSADLSGADLRYANLIDAKLIDANLSGANLRDAKLIDANLIDAKLIDANLSGANLSGANLRDANLSGANLRSACGNNIEILTIQLEKYIVNMTKDIIQIGCKIYSFEEWANFTDDEISNMDNGALEWWDTFKHIVLGAYRGVFK